MILIIGGGIIGLSTAYQLQLKHPSLAILVLEKENELSVRKKYYSEEGSRHTAPMRAFHNLIKSKLMAGAKPVKFEDETVTLKGRVTYNDIKNYWTICGINRGGNTLAIKLKD